jgi:DMSO/TMAO reductase YedYZ molybdopterin-dependent catalytic subunit
MEEDRSLVGRRRFLSTLGRVLALGAAARLSLRRALAAGELGVPVGESAPKVRGFPFEELDAFLTPIDRFFLRSHLEIPKLDPAKHRVQIGGWVERPYSLSRDDLVRMTPVTHPVTFECSGTSVGGGMLSTGEWSGPLMGPLIERARPRSGAVEVVMEGADAGLDELVPVPVQYARSFPLEVLKSVPALIALTLNSRTLPPEHGFPARAILPGLYGVQHVKWLSRLTVVPRPFHGFYQTQRYVAMVRVQEGVQVREILRQRIKSQIARVAPRPEAGAGTYRATGAAWSGGEGIRKVEVSTDGGRTWNPAEIAESHGPYAWSLWRYDWVPAAGTHEIVVRATDGAGRSQPLQRDPSVLTGYVNNWCHRKTLTVPG